MPKYKPLPIELTGPLSTPEGLYDLADKLGQFEINKAYEQSRRSRQGRMIVKMTLMKPRLGRVGEREMGSVDSRAGFECFWEITEPEIVAAFEGREFAYFEAIWIDDNLDILKPVDDEKW